MSLLFSKTTNAFCQAPVVIIENLVSLRWDSKKSLTISDLTYNGMSEITKVLSDSCTRLAFELTFLIVLPSNCGGGLVISLSTAYSDLKYMSIDLVLLLILVPRNSGQLIINASVFLLFSSAEFPFISSSAMLAIYLVALNTFSNAPSSKVSIGSSVSLFFPLLDDEDAAAPLAAERFFSKVSSEEVTLVLSISMSFSFSRFSIWSAHLEPEFGCGVTIAVLRIGVRGAFGNKVKVDFAPKG